MRSVLGNLSVAACCLFSCGRTEPTSASTPAAEPAPAPAPPIERAPTPSAEPAAASPAPAAVVAAPVAPEGPPRRVATGDGISITETSDGRVILKTTASWGEAIDTTYSDCGYYTRAIPVLEGQLAPERAKLLTQVCADALEKPTR